MQGYRLTSARPGVLASAAALVLLSLVLLRSAWTSTPTSSLLGGSGSALDRPAVLVVECGRRAGYAVAQSLLATHKFAVRGHTQEGPAGGMCGDLVPRGLELVPGDLDDAAVLTPALQGAWAAFLTTSFSEARPDDETVRGFRVIDAMLDAGVRHVVFNTVVDIARVSNGRYDNIPYFTTKHQIEDRLELERRSNRLDSLSLVYLGYYFQNFGKWTPTKQADGSYVFYFPVDPAEITLCCTDVNDLGPIVAAILQRPQDFDGVKVLAASECPTIAQIVHLMGQGTYAGR